MEPFSPDAVRGAYDAVAADYALAFGDELSDLPLDREMLDAALSAAGGDGWVLEAGCGPAPAAGYLAGRAARIMGLDLSAAMLTVAGTRNPGLLRVQADLRHVPLRSGCCSLVIAYYSLQHVPRADLTTALRELRRVLRAGGVLVMATHLGDGDVVLDEFLGHRVGAFAGALYRRDEVLEALRRSGLRVQLERQRSSHPDEYESERIYVMARSGD